MGSDIADIVATVAEFADTELIPAANARGEDGHFAEDIVERMRELGLFGTVIPRRYGGLELDLATHAAVTEEVARGWLSMAGVLNPHTLCSYLITHFGTQDQRAQFLPRMASGELRTAFSLTEPQAGSDVQAIVARGTLESDGRWRLDGHKRWITNGLGAGLVLVLVRTDPAAQPAHTGMTCFLVEKQPWATDNEGPWSGASITEDIQKMGDRGVETTDLVLDGYRCGPDRILGGAEGIGRGFVQMLDGMEAGRIGASSLCVGIAQRCLDVAMEYALRRETFGKPIAEHQAVQFKLADMAMKIAAARLLTRDAAEAKMAGRRVDLQAGMAKLFASEAAKEIAEEAFRIHGSYGYSQEYEVERLFRDALSLLSSEGPSEIQRLVIGRSLVRAARARAQK